MNKIAEQTVLPKTKENIKYCQSSIKQEKINTGKMYMEIKKREMDEIKNLILLGNLHAFSSNPAGTSGQQDDKHFSS